jgi:hypothetical protein
MRFRIGCSLLLIVVLLSAIACRRNRYRINTSGIKVNLEIKRLETDLFTLDPGKVSTSLPALKEKYRAFLQLFSYVINTGDINDPSYSDYLVRFCTDRLNNEVYAAVMKQYPDLTGMKRELEDAFRNYMYYFPAKKIPALYTCTTGFNNSIITGNSILGISLDRYLGAGCDYYKRLHIYKYLSDRMTPANIVPDCIYGWGASEWVFDSAGYKVDNVLTEMIHEGKLKYFERCMLPDCSDSLLFGFTSGQMKFCLNNEKQMWQYLVEHNLLFNTEQFTIRKLTGEAPFTSFFTNESPGRAATWIGFRIVESYMKKTPGVKLSDLMTETDIQKILQKARYDPR